MPLVQAISLDYNWNMIKEGLPEEYLQDLNTAVSFLNAEGCHEIYLFGSLSTGNFNQGSDIDLAVRGVDPKRYFSIYGQLLLQLKHPLDLVDLDIQPAFGKKLLESGQLQRIY